MSRVTIAGAVPVIASWDEPVGIAPRGTVVVVPGRGEPTAVLPRAVATTVAPQQGWTPG